MTPSLSTYTTRFCAARGVPTAIASVVMSAAIPGTALALRVGTEVFHEELTESCRAGSADRQRAGLFAQSAANGDVAEAAARHGFDGRRHRPLARRADRAADR